MLEVAIMKFQLHCALLGVVLVNVTQSGAHQLAGDGAVVNVTIGKGLTVTVTVSVAAGVVHPSLTVMVYVVLDVGVTVNVEFVPLPGIQW